MARPGKIAIGIMILDGLADGIHDFTCLKSRQLGITTISLAIDIFWLAVHPGIIGALVCDTETNRDTFRETLRRYVTSFPKSFMGSGFQLVKGGDNRSFMKFSNASRLDFLVAGTTNKASWGESRGYSLAHCTEVANYGNPAGLYSFREGLAEVIKYGAIMDPEFFATLDREMPSILARDHNRLMEIVEI